MTLPVSSGSSAIADFRELIWEFYRNNGRDLPWRHDPTSYQVFISEVMLQQTQVSRVLERYSRWLGRFPSFEALAKASVADVLQEWQGMGYNRRALWLRSAAQMVEDEFGGLLPRDPVLLMRLPGVGPNTAGSMAAFAYDEPTIFIETNIRRVFIFHYEDLSDGLVLPDANAVSDAQLRPLVEAALDCEHPREWYYALMDYGADLAKRVPNPNRRSKYYAVQSKFEGSLRQIRGEVLRRLLAGSKTFPQLETGDERLPRVLEILLKEGFIAEQDGVYRINNT